MDVTVPLTYTLDEWLDEFQPMVNHIDPTHGFNGCLFETFGRELEYVNMVDHRRVVWTVCEDDEGNLFMVNGYRIVNRIGFIVTENSYAEGELLTVWFDEGDA